ncbi:S8 family serine peptidase [Variovorax sp. YR752]|uniref:S8 family serine peptidase n=1 Tax=Variovorax sp. YR752 TaxID=1884383 RepID=UPI003137CE1B
MSNPAMKLIATLALSLIAPLGAQAQAVKSTTGGASTARVIVKYKSDSTLLRKQILAAGERQAAQAQALGARVGLPLRAGQGISERSQVVFATGMTSEALAARLAGEKDVEYAVPDRRKKRAAAPNDPLYDTAGAPGATSGGPVAGQWYLRAPSGSVRSAINAEAAWDITTGRSSVVVAVLDTGVRFDHPDLAGKLLPGYDFVDVDRDLNANPIPGSFLTAKDGDGYDDDPSDQGDGVTDAEANDVGGLFEGCPAEFSSWHGTQVSGIIGAATNNGTGMAGVGRKVRVLPVRVLAKCGGWDSDILAGMRWAAGLTVNNIANPNPAKVLNLSLGGGTTCTRAYRDVVSEINALGVVIVASAGNGNGHAVSEPASCDGVIGVGGLRHEGNKVGYSDIGPELTISAPAGNCVNELASQPCLYPILTTSNRGDFDPVLHTGGGSIYTDAFNVTVGTSFSAPLVAGTAALMFSVNSTLPPAEVRRLLMASARDFPALAGLDACVAPNGAEQLDCNCTTSTCGAGMLDTASAVTAAKGPLVRIGATPSQPVAGSALTLTSSQTVLISGRSVASYRWTLVDGGGIVTALSSTTGATASATPSGSGIFVVSLTVTDNTGASDAQTVEVSVDPASGGGGGGSGGGALGLGWLAALLAAAVALARRPRPARGH